MTEAHSDHGSILGPREAALVVDESGELSLRMPNYADDEPVPEMVLLLVAVVVLALDAKWRAEVLATLRDHH